MFVDLLMTLSLGLPPVIYNKVLYVISGNCTYSVLYENNKLIKYTKIFYFVRFDFIGF